MARRGRRGTLSPKTYFPSTGDQLECTSVGLLWECAKSNTSETPRGTKVRYALLMGFSPDHDEPVLQAIHDQDERGWLHAVEVIRRRVKSDDTMRTYDWDPETSTWKQRLEDA